ncbi:MAG: LacI family DNA-binding transcriptional regulator [Sphaerochaetaceae bacterium]
MAKYPTMKDVAKKANTTASTVSYVLSNKEGRYISEEMRERVLKVAKELNYVKFNGASSLKGKERKLIGIMVPQFANQFFTKLILEAEKVFVTHNFDMIICNTFDDPEREKEIVYRLLSQRVDGIIISPTIKGSENTEILRELGVKLVVVDRPLEGLSDYHFLTSDNIQAGRMGMRRLLDTGHKQIAYIGWDSGISSLEDRKNGALMEHPDTLVYTGPISDEDGYRLTQEVLEDHPDVDAIFYGFNIQAAGGMRYLKEHHIAFPDDISISIIGSPEWVKIGNNDIEHIDLNSRELGKEAANLMMEIIGKKVVKTVRKISSCILIEGASVKNNFRR